MKIAVAHDCFTQISGANRVAEELYRIVPGAELVTTVALADKLPPGLCGVPLRTSWMQRIPWMRQLHRFYFFLYPFAVESLDMSEFDLVVSSSWGYVKGLRTRAGSIHVCYCHNPMRWVWEYDGYVARERLSSVQKIVLPLVISWLKRWDLATARRPDHYITNSHYSAARIMAAYNRQCTVIYPPVQVDRFALSDVIDDYYLILARLVTYRRIDTAVAACTRLNRRLCVIGEGPDLPSLRAIAGPTVQFVGTLSNAEVSRYVSRCRALLFPGVEDFGIVAIEAAAAGRPTIAIRGGGAVETIVDGETGIFYEDQTPEAVADAIIRAENTVWDPHKIRRHALQFRPEVFRERLLDFFDEIGVSRETITANAREQSSQHNG